MSKELIKRIRLAALVADAKNDGNTADLLREAADALSRPAPAVQVPEGMALVPVELAEIVQPVNWREVHIGSRHMKLSTSYDYPTWQKMMDRLAQAPATAAADGVATIFLRPSDAALDRIWGRGPAPDVWKQGMHSIIDALAEHAAAPSAPAARESGAQDLSAYGYAPGGYWVICNDCKEQVDADKRALRCKPCAEKLKAERESGAREPQGMTAEQAIYFMQRFKSEEKLLGPKEQAAIEYVLAMLDALRRPVTGNLSFDMAIHQGPDCVQPVAQECDEDTCENVDCCPNCALVDDANLLDDEDDKPVAQGGGVDVEKVMALVEHYGTLRAAIAHHVFRKDRECADAETLNAAPPAASGCADDAHLSVRRLGGKLIISIGEDVLLNAIRFSQYMQQLDPDNAAVITNKDAFMEAIVSELVDEEEDGTTLVHRCLDTAAGNAIENGADGIEFPAPPAIANQEPK